MSIWLTLILAGLLTFSMRFSFIYLLGRVDVPQGVRRMLRYVPPAVLSALIVPELLMPTGRWDLSLDNHRWMAGLIAILVAWWSRNTLLTILAGAVALLLLQLIR